MKLTVLTCLLVVFAVVSCNKNPKHVTSISKMSWGKADAKEVNLYTLTNNTGMIVKITNFGAIVTAIEVPDKSGKIENVVLGFDSLAPYKDNSPYFGSIVGRYGNRIAKGKFTLNGTTYTLATNNGINHLHGGIKGFNKNVWDASDEFTTTDSVGFSLTYLSKDNEEGYPGNLTLKVTYTLTNSNELKIRYEAQTDKSTVLNPTNHSYFNLTAGKSTILNHQLTLSADSITPVDSTLIPLGNLVAVAGTPFDFTSAHAIGERIANVNGGYDHNFKLRKKGNELSLVAQVYESESGRLLEAYTTEPGVQFYTGNFLNGSITGSHGFKYEKHFGFCLETQHFPDSPNQPNFPSVVLNPGEKYKQLTIYKFSVK